jgi:N-acetylglutamate synthase
MRYNERQSELTRVYNMSDSIREIEHLTLRAWAALETEIYDGWILRFSNGYTGRANSVNPLDGSSLPLEEKIAYCENWYQARGLETKFRLNEAIYPPELDTILEQRAYERYNETLVQSADLSHFTGEMDSRFTHEATISDTWLADWALWNHAPEQHVPTAKAMLSKIEGAACFGRIGEAALGLAVLEANTVGLFDIVVSPDYRRQGLGRALVLSLLAWGKAQGADTVYLQVVANNHAALRLYDELGFETHHRYWYRRK